MLVKRNVTVSPICADKVFGEKTSSPFIPTVTTWFAEDDVEDAVTLAVAAAPVVVAYVVVSVAPSTVTVAVTVTVLTEAAAEVTEVEEFTALDWNVARSLPGLMAKTMPC